MIDLGAIDMADHLARFRGNGHQQYTARIKVIGKSSHRLLLRRLGQVKEAVPGDDAIEFSSSSIVTMSD